MWKNISVPVSNAGSGGSGGSSSGGSGGMSYHCLKKSALLTVWRTLNVECDAATWQGMPNNLSYSLGGFITTELARACVALRGYTNSTPAPNIGNPMNSTDYNTLIDGVGSGSGRDIYGNSKSFWTVRIVMASMATFQNPTPNNPNATVTPYGVFVGGTNTILIFYEKIKADHFQAGYLVDTLGTSIQQTILHEIGHVLGLGESGSGIMKSPLDYDEKLLPSNQKFLLSDIKTIQEKSEAKN